MGSGEYRTLDPSNQSRSVRYTRRNNTIKERDGLHSVKTRQQIIRFCLLHFCSFVGGQKLKEHQSSDGSSFVFCANLSNPYHTRIINPELSGHHGSPSRHTQIRGISRRGVFEANFLLVPTSDLLCMFN